jgi:hypothetical protein
MDKANQKRVLNETLSFLCTRIEHLIDTDKIPEEWNGFEMRWLITDINSENEYPRNRDRKRFKSYNNHRIVNNL